MSSIKSINAISNIWIYNTVCQIKYYTPSVNTCQIRSDSTNQLNDRSPNHFGFKKGVYSISSRSDSSSWCKKSIYIHQQCPKIYSQPPKFNSQTNKTNSHQLHNPPKCEQLPTCTWRCAVSPSAPMTPKAPPAHTKDAHSAALPAKAAATPADAAPHRPPATKPHSIIVSGSELLMKFQQPTGECVYYI